jgi:hypothetical protein
MSKLREKMIRAMELVNLSKHTQKAYLATLPGPFVNVFLHRSTGNHRIYRKMLKRLVSVLTNVSETE